MIKYKKIALIVLGCFFFAGVNAQGKYTINGKISGPANGMKVYLVKESWPEIKIVDSTVIQKNNFQFKGGVTVPSLFSIRIDKTPKGEKSSERNWLSSRFYLENSTISYSGHVDSLPPFYYSYKNRPVPPVIKGSATQDELVRFNESRSSLSKELAATNKDYLEKYHQPAMEGKFNDQIGLELGGKVNELSEKLDQQKWKYIKDNPKSVIAYDQASYYLNDMFISLTIPQIDELVKNVRKGWNGTPQMAALEKAAAKAKTVALGTKYKDFELTTNEGNKVMLSKYIPKGKIVMLEFWASWCGPCRAEIPHLRELNETRSDQFSIVSISLDENEKDWRKAMADEKMTWTQLVDFKGFEGEIAQAYNILGIPHSILLDEEGRVIKIGLRGAFLDIELNKLKKS
ncbi:MAG: TlpA disulfide reductase family protein [Ginsengibacter sp.]